MTFMLDTANIFLRACPVEAKPQTAPGVWEVALGLLDPSSSSVLVAGAGRGGLSWVLERTGYKVTSVDLHPEHFQISSMTCAFADLNDPLQFEDECFDVVMAVEVFEHLESPWLFLRESIRVLRPGGHIIFTTPNVESLASRITFLRKGLLPYFRDESFFGCYHVTPIFSWSVERCCQTTSARIVATRYSRVDWPNNNDIPRHDGNKGLRRALLNLLPVNRLTGEIACYKIQKTSSMPEMVIGKHYG